MSMMAILLAAAPALKPAIFVVAFALGLNLFVVGLVNYLWDHNSRAAGVLIPVSFLILAICWVTQ
jgi:hypothetical protein